MCGGTRAPSSPAALPEAPTPPTQSTERRASDRDRRRRAAAGGSGTILTGSGGVQNNAPTSQKTLLGT